MAVPLDRIWISLNLRRKQSYAACRFGRSVPPAQGGRGRLTSTKLTDAVRRFRKSTNISAVMRPADIRVRDCQAIPSKIFAAHRFLRESLRQFS